MIYFKENVEFGMPTTTTAAYLRLLVYLFIGFFTLVSKQIFAAYSCNVSASSVSAFYNSFDSTNDTNGTLALNCTRAAGDANTLTYRIKANDGLNVNGSQRRVRLGSTNNYINYHLTRGTTPGGSATCANATNWDDPATGTTNVITGTLSFASNLSASETWGYCIRLPWLSFPTAGVYTDVVQIYAQIPNSNAGVVTAPASLSFTSASGNQCLFRSFPSNIDFDYTSFSPSAQTASQTFDLRCSNSLPWSISVSPASNTVLGLNYSLSLTPSSGTGNGLNQTITLNGLLPANQAGSCPNAVCTGTAVHNIIVTY